MCVVLLRNGYIFFFFQKLCMDGQYIVGEKQIMIVVDIVYGELDEIFMDFKVRL